jgi:hypothetical protein
VIRLGSMVPPSLDRSVPLDLTDLVSVVAAYALWTHRHWAFALTYHWGLLLSTQALAFPAHTGPDFPHVGFLASRQTYEDHPGPVPEHLQRPLAGAGDTVRCTGSTHAPW